MTVERRSRGRAVPEGSYMSTLSMASESGGGMVKQTPGKVLVFPSGETTAQFSMSELDFRVNLSSLDRVS